MPTTTIVLPTLNERAHITDCLASLTAQQGADVVEVLVVDGGSTDGTREIVAAHPRPRPPGRQPAGDRRRRHERGHRRGDRGPAVPGGRPHDLRLRLRGALRRGAGGLGCGQRRRPDAAGGGEPLRARRRRRDLLTPRHGPGQVPLRGGTARGRHRVPRVLASRRRSSTQGATTRSPSSGRPRTRSSTGGCARRGGGSCSTRPSGPGTSRGPHRGPWPASTPTTAWPRPRPSPSTAGCRPGAPSPPPPWSPRPPGSRWRDGGGPPALAVPLVHTAVVAAAGLRMGRAPGVAPHRAAAALAICHWSYGAGFWRGVARIATGRRFDSRPVGHR